MKCIICEQDCDTPHEDLTDSLHPYVSGTTFESTGNYGSRHWDCEGRKYLQIVFCNDCLPKKAGLIDVVSWTKPHVPPRELVNRESYQEFRDKENLRYQAWADEVAEEKKNKIEEKKNEKN
jgi:hypothetical protein